MSLERTILKIESPTKTRKSKLRLGEKLGVLGKYAMIGILGVPLLYATFEGMSYASEKLPLISQALQEDKCPYSTVIEEDIIKYFGQNFADDVRYWLGREKKGGLE